jgi:hypothetical protein
MAFGTDQILWYNQGAWGELGYAVPNFGDNPTTLNAGIQYLTSVMGRNLSALLHGNPDVDLRSPPTINTLVRVHKLILRFRQITGNRKVGPGTPMQEAVHSSPAELDHLVYPVPYFKVRNGWIKEWSGLVLMAISEAIQHTDNRRTFDFSEQFAGIISQYMQRIYRNMAVELFGTDAVKAAALDFILTDAELSAYDPTKFFTSTEMIDTIPAPTLTPTEDDLRLLTDGLPASMVTGLQKWPSGAAVGSTTAAAATGSATSTVAAFSAAPSP